MDYNKLVADCLKQKPDAQKQLYEHFAPSMLGVCFRYTKSIKDAEDVLQEGFIKVYKHLNQYKYEGEPGAWIRKIMVNTALTYLKKNRKYQYDLSFKDVTLHPVSVDDPAVTLQTKELADLIRQLPTGFQTIFNLHAIEGYSHVEIADMLGITDGTSRSQYARARALLIKWIDKFSFEDKSENYAKK
jgi:RNA polymerase sigma factor (sigma-70 family)